MVFQSGPLGKAKFSADFSPDDTAVNLLGSAGIVTVEDFLEQVANRGFSGLAEHVHNPEELPDSERQLQLESLATSFSRMVLGLDMWEQTRKFTRRFDPLICLAVGLAGILLVVLIVNLRHDENVAIAAIDMPPFHRISANDYRIERRTVTWSAKVNQSYLAGKVTLAPVDLAGSIFDNRVSDGKVPASWNHFTLAWIKLDRQTREKIGVGYMYRIFGVDSKSTDKMIADRVCVIHIDDNRILAAFKSDNKISRIISNNENPSLMFPPVTVCK